MDVVFLIGRILFGLIFIGSGIGHLAQADSSAEFVQSKGLPSAKNLVLLSGVCLLAGGVAVILGIWMDLAGFCIAALVLIIGFALHRFWEESDPQMQQTEMSMFMKNLSIAGGALVIASVAENAPFTITDAIF